MKAKIQHEIQEYCSLLRLNAIGEHFEEAIKNATDYEGFLHQLLRMEVDAEEERAKERKIKAAKFPCVSRKLRTAPRSDCGCRISSSASCIRSSPSDKICTVSAPPIPAIKITSASDGLKFSRPSESRVSILSSQ